MTTKEVAFRLYELCSMGKMKETIEELYADNAVAIEADESMGEKIVAGKAAILEKEEQFNSYIEAFYGAKISEPLVAGPYFTLSWWVDWQMKGQERMQMEEICLYKVENGKIVSAQFFY